MGVCRQSCDSDPKALTVFFVNARIRVTPHRSRPMVPIASLTTTTAAAAMLDPTRLAILDRLRQPGSAASVAAQLGAPRQRIGYHVRELERVGLVSPVTERAHG